MLKFFFSLVIVGCAIQLSAQTPEEQRFLDTLKMGGSYLIGKKMNAFDLQSINNVSYNNDSLNNKVTLINFWFEACAPCIAEMGTLNDLYKDFKGYDKFRFLSFTYENKETARKLAAKYNMAYPIISTSPEICMSLNYRKGYPTTIITDATGTIVYFEMGGPLDPETSKKIFLAKAYPLLESLLK